MDADLAVLVEIPSGEQVGRKLLQAHEAAAPGCRVRARTTGQDKG